MVLGLPSPQEVSFEPSMLATDIKPKTYCKLLLNETIIPRPQCSHEYFLYLNDMYRLVASDSGECLLCLLDSADLSR